MNVDKIKRLVALLLVGAGAFAVVVAVGGAGRIQQWASAGADPAAAFTEVPAIAPGLERVVTWLPDAPLQQRTVEPVTRQAIETAWTRAWEAQHRAAMGDASLLEAWFSGGALAQAQSIATSVDRPVQLRLGEHQLRVTFYSDDGAVMGVRADPVHIVRIIEIDGGWHTQASFESFDVVLLLEDGNWRVRQWQRTGAEPADPTS